MLMLFPQAFWTRKFVYTPHTHTHTHQNKHCFVFLSYVCQDVLRVIDRHCMPVNFNHVFLFLVHETVMSNEIHTSIFMVLIFAIWSKTAYYYFYIPCSERMWAITALPNFLHFTTLSNSSLLYLFTIFLLSIQTLVADSLFHFACL